MSNRLDQEREARLQPLRVARFIDELAKRGIKPVGVNDTTVRFEWRGSVVTYYPYSGWATGKTITDGRGLKNLLKQLDQVEDKP